MVSRKFIFKEILLIYNPPLFEDVPFWIYQKQLPFIQTFPEESISIHNIIKLIKLYPDLGTSY